jgi:hypothetical protein
VKINRSNCLIPKPLTLTSHAGRIWPVYLLHNALLTSTQGSGLAVGAYNDAVSVEVGDTGMPCGRRAARIFKEPRL